MALARRAMACVVAMALGLGFAPRAHALPGEVIEITDPQLTNSNALAADFNNGLYWTANPGPDGTGVVQALYQDGSTAGQVTFDAQLVDVQALSFFEGQLYIGDIGDPNKEREHIVVYRLESLYLDQPTYYTQWTLRYPDGPHDAATMMVSPRGNIWVITKDADAALYYAPAPGESGDVLLEYVTTAPAWLTDGTFIGPTTAVLRSYTGVYTFNMTEYYITAQAAAPAQPQGESITESLDGDGLVLGSRDDPRLLGVSMPIEMAEIGDAPSVPPGPEATAPPAPSPSPSPAPSPEPTSEPTQPPGSGFTSGKTVTALVIAFLVSVAAGVLAYRRPRPSLGDRAASSSRGR